MQFWQKLKAGFPASASWLNSLSEEVQRLGKIHGSGQVQVGNGPGGYQISLAPEIRTVWAKFTATAAVASYPAYDSGAVQFPAEIYGAITYDTSDPSNAAVLGPFSGEVLVCNLTEAYIDEDTVVEIWKLNGKWYTNVPQAHDIEFTLTASFNGSASSQLTLDRWDNGGRPRDTSPVISSALDFNGDSGAKGTAVWYPSLGEYRVQQMDC